MKNILFAGIAVFALSLGFVAFATPEQAYAAGPKCYSQATSEFGGGVQEFSSLCSLTPAEIEASGFSISGLPDKLENDHCYFWSNDPIAPPKDVTAQCGSSPYSTAPPYGSNEPGTVSQDNATKAAQEQAASGLEDEKQTRDDLAKCNSPSECLEKNPIVKIINMAIDIMTAVAGIAIVLGIIVGGIQYSTSGANPQAVSAAKGHIINAVLALLGLIFLFSFLQWLIPGGIF